MEPFLFSCLVFDHLPAVKIWTYLTITLHCYLLCDIDTVWCLYFQIDLIEGEWMSCWVDAQWSWESRGALLFSPRPVREMASLLQPGISPHVSVSWPLWLSDGNGKGPQSHVSQPHGHSQARGCIILQVRGLHGSKNLDPFWKAFVAFPHDPICIIYIF